MVPLCRGPTNFEVKLGQYVVDEGKCLVIAWYSVDSVESCADETSADVWALGLGGLGSVFSFG